MFYKLAGNQFTKFQWNFPSTEEIAILKIKEFSKDLSHNDNRTKFLHAIIDLPSLNISHCDGANIQYSPDEYKSHYEGNSIKGSDYEKLFRFDGKMCKEI